MAVNYEIVSEKLFNILKGFGYNVRSYNKEGDLVINPQEATRFAVQDPNLLARLDLAEKTIMLATSEDLSEEPVRDMIKDLAQDYLMSFDYKIFNRKIKPKGEEMNVKKSAEKDMADVMEASFNKLSGSSKSSYQGIDEVKIVLRHKKAIDEEKRGARSRDIHSMYIKRGQEMFKLPENNLAMARAMARHIHNGGETFDTVGQTITEMAKDYRQLREFVRYVKNSKLVNEDNQEIVELAVENIQEIKSYFKRLQGVKSYANAVESLNDYTSVEVLTDDIDIESKFTETHFDDKVANVTDNLKNLISRKKSFESYITKAVESENFAGLKDSLTETDVMDFENPNAKLGHQVSMLGQTAKDERLSNYLQNLSSKVSNGGKLSQFEYGTIKSCLLSANNNSYTESTPMDVAEAYEVFISQFAE